MDEKYMSLTELGRLYGVSRVRMGQWLVDLGLRTQGKKPSHMAFNGGFVDQRPSTQLDTYFWVWHAAKTIRLLDEAGHERVQPPEVPSDPAP
jgi:hypothetical protein